MNINIEPLKYTESGPFKLPLYDPEDVEKLEANFKEAIEALTILLKNIERYGIMPEHKRMFLDTYELQINIIEKATGQKWEDMK